MRAQRLPISIRLSLSQTPGVSWKRPKYLAGTQVLDPKSLILAVRVPLAGNQQASGGSVRSKPDSRYI